ncbi:hypothetical protein EVAR_3422_1 [Eumeta japonica]|uniref:Uncharacterized protein n=1 Tax=Eumeta variegata TaxID=151549 RepID=A0A4C1SVM0_EUMVA|nr:hypothetical protein EVAR_3422_1 [Eumeta japonica]
MCERVVVMKCDFAAKTLCANFFKHPGRVPTLAPLYSSKQYTRVTSPELHMLYSAKDCCTIVFDKEDNPTRRAQAIGSICNRRNPEGARRRGSIHFLAGFERPDIVLRRGHKLFALFNSSQSAGRPLRARPPAIRDIPHPPLTAAAPASSSIRDELAPTTAAALHEFLFVWFHTAEMRRTNRVHAGPPAARRPPGYESGRPKIAHRQPFIRPGR